MARPERVCDSILDTIGDTPLVRIRRMNPEPGVVILAKLEGFNPMGSVKERIALRIVEEAKRRGELRAATTLVASIIGNTGIAMQLEVSEMRHPVVRTAQKDGQVLTRTKLKQL